MILYEPEVLPDVAVLTMDEWNEPIRREEVKPKPPKPIESFDVSPVIDEKGDVYFGSEDGYVYALNVDGSLKWNYATGDGVTAAPLVATMDRIYVGSKSGNFYCFNRDNGNVIWEYTTTNEIYSSAVIDSSGRLIFGDLGGNLTCLDSEFGTLYTADDVETQGDEPTAKVGEVKTVDSQVKSIQYSVLYMKAIKALQEAMARIETLEAKVTALEG